MYNGEEFSPSKAAEFVLAHADDLSYIPGKVRLDTPLPLTFEQLTELYRSNRLVSESDEEELLADLLSTYGEEIIEIANRVFAKLIGRYA